jgi:hypothetical protein
LTSRSTARLRTKPDRAKAPREDRRPRPRRRLSPDPGRQRDLDHHRLRGERPIGPGAASAWRSAAFGAVGNSGRRRLRSARLGMASLVAHQPTRRCRQRVRRPWRGFFPPFVAGTATNRPIDSGSTGSTAGSRPFVAGTATNRPIDSGSTGPTAGSRPFVAGGATNHPIDPRSLGSAAGSGSFVALAATVGTGDLRRTRGDLPTAQVPERWCPIGMDRRRHGSPLASSARYAQYFRHAHNRRLRRFEAEALAALPGGTGPGALTARTATTERSLRARRLQGPRHRRR